MKTILKASLFLGLFFFNLLNATAQKTFQLEMNRVVVDQNREPDGDRPYFVTIHFRVGVNQRGSTVSTVIEQEPHDWVSKPEFRRGTIRGKDGNHMVRYDQLDIPWWMGGMEWRNFDMLTIDQIVNDPSKVNEIELFGALILALDNNNTPPHFVRDLMNKFNARFTSFLKQKVEREGFALALQLATNGTAAVNALKTDLLGLTKGLFGVSDAIDWTFGSTFNPDAIVGANLLVYPNITGFSPISSTGSSKYLGKWVANIQSPQDINSRLNFEGSGAKYHVNYSLNSQTCGNSDDNRRIYRNVTIAIKTGQDDLRGGSQASAKITLKDGRTFTGSLNNGQEWKKNSNHYKDIRLADGVREQDIASVEISFRSGSCFACDSDKWDINSLRLYNGNYEILTVHGFPAKRFNDNIRTWNLGVYNDCRQMLIYTPGTIEMKAPVYTNGKQNKVYTPKTKPTLNKSVEKYKSRGTIYYPPTMKTTPKKKGN